MRLSRPVSSGMIRRLGLFGGVCALFWLGASGMRATTLREFAPTRESWMSISMGGKKVGHARIRVTPTRYQNRPALRMVSESRTRLKLLGSTVEQEEALTTITDTDYRPLTQTLDVKSGGSDLRITALYDYAARKVSCYLNAGGATTEKTLAIPPNATLAADANFLTQGRKLAVGQRFKLVYLNPLRVALEEARVEVSGRAAVTDGLTGNYASVYVVRQHLSLGEGVSWQTDDGDTVKAQMSVGGLQMTLTRQRRATALRGENAPVTEAKIYDPPTDFAIATAIKTDRPIVNARSVRGLRATIEGLPDRRFVLEDARQKAEILTKAAPPARLTARYAITAADFDAAQSLSAPVTAPEFASSLRKSAYLDTGDLNIQSESARLRGHETNLYRIAVHICEWVNKNMTPDVSIGVPRSASDIFLRRRGVCRDYATLYTALARAAGIPTRLCAGIVYGNGMFFYHAWAESYVGQWIPMDPTLYDPAHPIAYVDATHIKFAEGDVTDMFDALAIVGKLRITVQAVTL